MQQLEQRRREFELKLSEIEQKVQERSNQLLSDSKEITKAAVEASGKFESYQKTLTWVFIGLAIFGLLFAGIEIWQGSKSLKIEGPIITIEATPTLEPPTVTPIPEPDHPMSTEEREPTS